MTSRERFLTALAGGIPDRVPAAPDMSNYIPAKRTGLPFWEIYFNGTIPLWRAYLDNMRYFGGEAWVASCTGIPLKYEDSPVEFDVHDTFDADRDSMVRHTTIRTPTGDLTAESTCFRSDPPSPHEKPIKNFEKDWQCYKWLLRRMPSAIDRKQFDLVRTACAQDNQAFGMCVGYPGFHSWDSFVQGSVQTLSYALTDTPEVLDEWFELDLAFGTKAMELYLAEKPDYVLLGGSGTITLASPALARKYAIPALKKWSKMAKDAGVVSMLHSCGRSRVLVDMLVEETDVQSINPLEIRPMGDIDLAEVKKARGNQISLMGNLHTTDVILYGKSDTVRRAALQAMADAGAGGGFILSSGDQCPRDTPEENLFAMVETAKTYGVYDEYGNLPAVREALTRSFA